MERNNKLAIDNARIIFKNFTGKDDKFGREGDRSFSIVIEDDALAEQLANDGWNVTSPLSLLNAKLLAYADEIRSAVLVIHGDQAHSCYFSHDAFAKLQGDNKELLLIPGAVHTDLYDRMDIIPFDRIEAFYHQYLK